MNRIDEQIKNYPYTLILGSASPRRQELLKGLGFEFTVKPSHADESFPENLMAQEIALFLAQKKSDAYTDVLKKSELLITADTIVWCEGKIYNKPADFEDGMKMLGELSGKMHQVFTAVCLRTDNKRLVFYEESKVYFKPFTRDETDYYLTNYKPYDKAGAYGVQDWLGYTGINKIEGSFYNVMGLPVKLLFDALMTF